MLMSVWRTSVMIKSIGRKKKADIFFSYLAFGTNNNFANDLIFNMVKA